MRHCVLLCMLLFQQSIYAQDWQLFRKGAKSIYESKGFVYSFSIDTSEHNKTNLIIPNAELYLDSFLSCNPAFVQTEQVSGIYNLQDDPFRLFSYYNTDSGVLVFDSIFIKTDMLPGDSTIQNIRYPNNIENKWVLKCISLGIADVLNMTDSIRNLQINVVSVPGGQTLAAVSFRLSKNFGLLDLIPFNNLNRPVPYNYSTAKLKGFHNGSINKGITFPTAPSWFRKEAGQVLVYKYITRNPPFYYDDITYVKDSILAVSENSFGFMIAIRKQSWKNDTMKAVWHDTARYYFKDIEYAGVAATAYPFNNPAGFRSNEWVLNMNREISFSGTDTVHHMFFNEDCLFKDSCFYQVTDCGSYKDFDSRYGLIRWHEGWYTDVEMVGFRNSRESWGYLNVGRNETIRQVVTIYPNPVVDKIYMENVTEGSLYQILSVNGNTMQIGELKGNIDVSGLKPGWYCLEILLSEKLVRVPFIRQ